MKVLPFTIPVPHDHTIIVQDEVLPYFYPHLHRHKEIQLTHILEGDGTLIVVNNMHTFRSGDVFLLGPNQPHVFKNGTEYFEPDSTKQVRALTLFFDPEGKLKSLFTLPEMKAIHGFIQQMGSGFKVPQAQQAAILILLKALVNSEGTDQLLNFIHLLKYFSKAGDMQPIAPGGYTGIITDTEGMRIGVIYDYIVENAGKAMSLEEIATRAHMTVPAFCRYFKKHTRHTFVAFLNKIRINNVCKMLNEKQGANISAIAYTCGFTSINNFNRVFKTVTGKTPREYIQHYNGLQRH
ncbi:AraC family transcriptional regulator [Mucilaginibacter segetis]|uniref:Helix-turn-helix domain-containing protein n=1 Tax=Mucilaginibacter segetis TaxID=2793071 RepID=A0A934PTB4_9SPHI|nr:AraC family transcriptional regulator [Mucilaginibacter segetis]MBK0379649.1 helix-turn-helix domain-containing protein [Mucilaginibacter segetis]